MTLQEYAKWLRDNHDPHQVCLELAEQLEAYRPQTHSELIALQDVMDGVIEKIDQ